MYIGCAKQLDCRVICCYAKDYGVTGGWKTKDWHANSSGRTATLAEPGGRRVRQAEKLAGKSGSADGKPAMGWGPSVSVRDECRRHVDNEVSGGAATGVECSSSQRSASIAAMQPVPAALTA
jgi:hypothetical protein